MIAVNGIASTNSNNIDHSRINEAGVKTINSPYNPQNPEIHPTI
jgi:hypothetical protein